MVQGTKSDYTINKTLESVRLAESAAYFFVLVFRTLGAKETPLVHGRNDEPERPMKTRKREKKNKKKRGQGYIANKHSKIDLQ